MGPELVVRFDADLGGFKKGLSQMRQETLTLNRSFDKSTQAVEKFNRQTRNSGNDLRNLATDYLSVAAVLGAGKAFIAATIQVESFQGAIKAAGRTQEDFAHNMAFVEGVADTYKKNTVELGKSFAALANATKGTNLEGKETERLFKATVAAASALKLSTDDTTGALRAFAQMVSKGNVQAEELRGQLGERLYGAFNLAAKAMGVSTSELNKMLERGEVLAEDLLPKISTEMEKAFGDQAIANARSLGSNIDYATGQATLFFAEMGKSTGITDAITDLAGALGDILNRLRELNKQDNFLDALFTLPGQSFGSGGGSNDPIRDAADKALEKSVKSAQDLSNTAAYNIGDRRSGRRAKEEDLLKQQAEDAKKAAEKLAKAKAEAEKKAKAALNAQRDAWNLEDIELEYKRIQEKGAKIAAEVAKIEERLARSVGPIRSLDKKFITAGATALSAGSGEKYSRPIENAKGGTGDISATSFSESPDRFLASMSERIAEMGAIPGIDWAEKLNTEGLAQANATLGELTESMQTTIIDGLATAAANALQGMGEIGVALATGAASMQDVGQMIAGILSQLAAQLGQSLITMGMALLVGGPFTAPMAAGHLAAGAALMVVSGVISGLAKKDKPTKKMASGGVATGRGGVDNIPTMLTRGEMVLNDMQQRRLFGMLDGTRSYESVGVGGGQVKFVIEGNNLVGVLRENEQKRRAYR